MNKRLDEAQIIVLASVITAAPRWITALLSSQGIVIPAGWLEVWTFISFVCALGMSVVEAFALKYVWHAYRSVTKGTPQSKILIGLIGAAALVFVFVLAPDIYAQARHESVGAVLGDVVLAAWSAMVALSTIVIVSAVGYAMRKDFPMKSQETPTGTGETPASGNMADSRKTLDYAAYVRLNENRNGNGLVTAQELVKDFNIPKSTAYRWHADYQREVGRHGS